LRVVEGIGREARQRVVDLVGVGVCRGCTEHGEAEKRSPNGRNETHGHPACERAEGGGARPPPASVHARSTSPGRRTCSS
jgi:hypothetical protein